MGQHKVAKAIKEKHVIKFQKFDSPKSQKLTLIIRWRALGIALTCGTCSISMGQPVDALECERLPRRPFATTSRKNQYRQAMSVAGAGPRQLLLSGPCPVRASHFPLSAAGFGGRAARPVWCSDITYLRLSRGFLFLTVVLDWFSRYVFAAFQHPGEPLLCARPGGNRSQFTGSEFTSVLGQAGVRIHGRAWPLPGQHSVIYV